jgi:hypothetical protein
MVFGLALEITSAVEDFMELAISRASRTRRRVAAACDNRLGALRVLRAFVRKQA